ncbi:VOC family protein [Yinghuangia seranimata]|uniref:VOC family protein n=1 Tax=Yinghuangia seranimata TaxID=408067 RepID=UPI00248CEACF|nr:VOC family protein [Yinghuangia seranimata]MDI2125423.1 VOC family protein [Yinghuangia seranimata]
MAVTPGAGPFSAVGRFVVLVDDLDDGLAFYRDILGFAVLHDETTAGFRYLHIGLPGQEAAGLWLMPADSSEARAHVGKQAAGHPMLVLYTDDLDAVEARLAQHGVRVWARTADPGSRSLQFADLYGNTIVAAELRDQPTASTAGLHTGP